MDTKKKRKILMPIGIIVACLILAVFVVKPSKEEIFAKEFLSKLYDISDYQQFTYLTKASVVSSASSDVSETEKYKDYFTESGYDGFVSQQIYGFYEELAYENKCTLSLKSIKFQQTSYEAFDGTRKFFFTATVNAEYHETGETKTITQDGTISVITVNGQSKIDTVWFNGHQEIKAELDK